MAIAPQNLQTERLVLRHFSDSDIDSLHELWTGPDVRKFLWEGEKISREKTAEIISESGRLLDKEGTGLWAVEDTDKNQLIGFGGYWYFFEPPQLQILYGLHPEHWGTGLATELTRRLIDYGFETLNLSRVVGSTDKPNISSQRVMEKAGMVFLKRDRKRRMDMLTYLITRDEWNDARK